MEIVGKIELGMSMSVSEPGKLLKEWKSCDQKEKQGIKSRVMLLELLAGNWWGNENFRPEGNSEWHGPCSHWVALASAQSHIHIMFAAREGISDACWYFL